MKLPTIFKHMQAAVDIVGDSAHPTNKIAATIAGTDENNNPFTLSRTNHWPPAIAEKIGTKPDIGSSSGTIHAETACIFAAPKTDRATIFITDPPCPNCMKNMAEAGIKALYIDHKGFDKDWAKRRGDSFDQMSMRVAEKAGIDVYVIYRKEERFEIISRHAQGYKPSIENPPVIRHCEEAVPTKQSTEAFWVASLSLAMTEIKEEPFSIALAKNAQTQTVSILVNRHPTIGYTSETVEAKDGKYSFILQPVNRLLMIAAKDGLKLEQIYSSRCPTSRELVNMVGAGITELKIGDQNTARDEFGPQALKQLLDAKILRLS